MSNVEIGHAACGFVEQNTSSVHSVQQVKQQKENFKLYCQVETHVFTLANHCHWKEHSQPININLVPCMGKKLLVLVLFLIG